MSREVRDSLRVLAGEEVLESDRGGGEENLRQRCGDFPSARYSPLLFWLVAKNSSKDLRGRNTKRATRWLVEGGASQGKKAV